MSVFDTLHKGSDGYSYYDLSIETLLFKAGNDSNNTMVLSPDKHYFFGVANTDKEYIKEYEDLYGIIFEFKTKRPYKLLALDNEETMKKLYNEAPPKIQKILKHNYGYRTGIRYSDGNKDRELSQYLCKKSFEGYATNTMKTDFEGTFHPEFMICNVSDIEFVRRVTSDKRADILFEKAILSKLDNELKKPRKKTRRHEDDESPYKNVFGFSKASIDYPPTKKAFTGSTSPSQSLLFDSPTPSPNRKLFGEKRTKTRKNKKSPK